MASLEVKQQQQGGEDPSSSGDGGNHEKEVSRTEHAQKSEVEAASSTDACKKQLDTVNHPLVNFYARDKFVPKALVCYFCVFRVSTGHLD